jgi:hypothetical protein
MKPLLSQFDIWWPDKDVTPGLTDEIFETNKSFCKLLEEFKSIQGQIIISKKNICM